MSISIENIEFELTNLLNEELNHLVKEGKAIINTQPEGNGFSFSLTPFDNRHASIYAFYENGGIIVYLTVGYNTVLEVPIEGKGYTNISGQEELLSIIRAVVNQGFEETIYENKGKIVKSVGKLFIKNETEPITMKNSTLHNPFSRMSIIVKKYIPY